MTRKNKHNDKKTYRKPCQKKEKHNKKYTSKTTNYQLCYLLLGGTSDFRWELEPLKQMFLKRLDSLVCLEVNIFSNFLFTATAGHVNQSAQSPAPVSTSTFLQPRLCSRFLLVS